MEEQRLMRNTGYGLHYPIRHGQIENWVRFILFSKFGSTC